MVHDVKGLLAGEGLGSEVVRARALVSNFLASTVETNTAGLHLRLEPISLSADRNPQDPAHAGNVIPTCLLSLERLEGYTGPSLPEAIEIFGWLLSFYAGRAVHPFAWEGETGNGRIWSIRTEDVDPLPIPTVTTCLQSDGLAPFLARAWVTWLSLGDVHQRRLRGVVNVYRTILANPFPTQKVALIATYLERFRALVVDNRTPLEKVNAREKKLDEEELAAFLKGTLKNLLVFVPDLSDQDLADLSRAIDRIQGGKMHDLLRPSFASTLMELYGRVRLLPINQEVLRRFIQERNQVIHGRWNADREGAMATFWWSEYGLNLLERLILRFFGYEGPYWNRVKGSAEGFEHRDPKW
jgi:hypothetical protein